MRPAASSSCAIVRTAFSVRSTSPVADSSWRRLSPPRRVSSASASSRASFTLWSAASPTAAIAAANAPSDAVAPGTPEAPNPATPPPAPPYPALATSATTPAAGLSRGIAAFAPNATAISSLCASTKPIASRTCCAAALRSAAISALWSLSQRIDSLIHRPPSRTDPPSSFATSRPKSSMSGPSL